MKILSWNVRGLGGPKHCMVVRDIISKNKVSIVMLQESKLSSMSDTTARALWRSKSARWLSVDAAGSVGGILMLRDTRYATVLNS